MGITTKISYVHHTFSPWFGCSPVSAGCNHCYARNDFSIKLRGIKWGPDARRVIKAESGWSEPLRWNRAAEKAGVRRRVFCGSLCDVFEDRPELERPRMRLFDLIAQCTELDFLLLTKRPENIGAVCPAAFVDRANIWIGVTVENQAMADKRIPILLRIPAAVRFLSVEPMLEEIDLSAFFGGEYVGLPGDVVHGGYNFGISWAICGGESGPNCRPCDPDWIRSIVRQCRAAQVPVWVKQLGGHPAKRERLDDLPEDLRIRELPK